jgi:hypothetical protein
VAVGRELRRELRAKRRAYRQVYEEAFGCRYRTLHRTVPYSRVLAVGAVAGCLTTVLTLLGLVVWVSLPTTLALSPGRSSRST